MLPPTNRTHRTINARIVVLSALGDTWAARADLPFVEWFLRELLDGRTSMTDDELVELARAKLVASMKGSRGG